MLEFLPPDIRALIEKRFKKQAVTVVTLKKQQEEKKLNQKKKIKFDYKMVNCNEDLKLLTKKLKASKVKNYGLLLYGVSGW